jgi:hypothetical protein
MIVEPGTKEDWDQLHEFHYKAENLPLAPRYWRCVTKEGRLIGIVVFSSVSLLLAARHQIFPKLKPGGDENNFTNVQRARWLNRNMNRAARIVTDPMYRGVGVSYRMVNLAMRMQGKKWIEIQSSMSKFNPFDIKAGFSHGRLNHASSYDKGFRFMRGLFEAHPADYMALVEEFEALPAALQKRTLERMCWFYYKNSPKEKTGSNLGRGNGKVNSWKHKRIIKELQTLIFSSPAYGIWQNPDLGQVIPVRLPLSAFDLQSPTEPLKLEEL